ncbi:BolA family protein [Leeia aquatica]|uniref:BolA family protein n=1 Tax=Leeia aquatica TaxID=2725557 RepID=UPI00197E6E80|nr:BolA family protein [Leeia aquatica]
MSDIEALFAERLAPLQPSHIELVDESGEHIGHAGNTGGGHYWLTVVSESFRGQSRLARHRLVLTQFSDLIPGTIHALSIAAYAPDEL